MSFFEIGAALAFAVFIGLFFSYVFRIKGPWGRLWSFILVLFLIIWASEVWIPPAGPVWNEIAWLPLLIAGIVAALLLTAVSPRISRKKAPGDQAPLYYRTGIFYWVFIITILILIIAGIFASS